MGLTIELEHLEGSEASVCLNLQGEVDMHTSHQLRKRLKPLLTSKSTRVQVNLTGVDMMDTAGIATLAEGLEWSMKSGGKFVLSGLSERLRDVLALANLDTAFEIEGQGDASR